jgi:hypothetical protein
VLAVLVPMGLACALGDIYNGGCGSRGTEDITAADLVGTWSGTEAGRITLKADSSFDAADLREKDGNGTRLVSGHGIWTLNQTSSKDPTRRPDTSDIGLTFVQPDGTNRTWNRIDVGAFRPVSRLQYLVGEAESCDLRTLDKEPR